MKEIKNDNIVKIRGCVAYERANPMHYEDVPENLAQQLLKNPSLKAFTAKIVGGNFIQNPNSQIEVIKKPDGSHYLRTSANCKEEDNLDNLPTF